MQQEDNSIEQKSNKNKKKNNSKKLSMRSLSEKNEHKERIKSITGKVQIKTPTDRRSNY